MSNLSGEGSDALPVDAEERIANACRRFESGWKEGQPAQLEDGLAGTEGLERLGLFRDLLKIELRYRAGRGEAPRMAEYEERFLEFRSVLGCLWPEAVPAPPERGSSFRLVLTVVQGPHLGQAFAFTEHDTFIVGRSKKAHFRLPLKDDALSRLHFLVEVSPPHCRVMDVGSTNGTFVNDKRIRAADLAHGDEIKAGETVLRVIVEEEGGERVTRRVEAPASQESASLSGPASPTGDWHPASLVPTPGAGARQGPAPGTEIGGYRLVRELGSGGMGVVFLARRVVDDTVVALKAIKPAVHSSRLHVERFLREVEILRRLEHPLIVRFLEIGEAHGHLYFAMEYVEGSDAARLLEREGPFDVGRAVRLICQVLEALEYAHGQGFVHRDVKPSNVMVSEGSGGEVVRLVDFGLARVYQTSKLSGLTVTGQMGGTPAFAAPEQITDFRNAQPGVDQYATAATLYKLLTGKYVYDFSEQAWERIVMILQHDPVPIRQRRPDLSADLAEVLHRALAREPGDRFPDVAALRQALEPFAD